MGFKFDRFWFSFLYLRSINPNNYSSTISYDKFHSVLAYTLQINFTSMLHRADLSPLKDTELKHEL